MLRGDHQRAEGDTPLDGGEHVVEVVRDAPREDAEALQLLHVKELRLVRRHCFPRADELRNVEGVEHYAVNRIPFPAKRDEVDVEEAILFVVPDAREPNLVGRPRLAGPVDPVERFAKRRRGAVERASEGLSDRIVDPDHLAVRLVHERIQVLRAVQHRHVRGDLGEGVEESVDGVRGRGVHLSGISVPRALRPKIRGIRRRAVQPRERDRPIVD